MIPVPVIAVFDIGKTNKKFFLFDEQYRIVLERSSHFDEITDEDGDACDDVFQLTHWVKNIFEEVSKLPSFHIAAFNFSAYGASFVHIDANGQVVAPLYNYLKPFSQQLRQAFYNSYGDETSFSVATSSPALDNLNSGLQLYRLKYQKKELFDRIQYSLHLPQYLGYLFTGKAYSDITSIGCHTALWNFSDNRYHEWVEAENILSKLAPIFPGDQTVDAQLPGVTIKCGIGLHDSSAALIPYLTAFHEPFVLISTGTWCISLNPFNDSQLTVEELKQDCLCYLDYKGHPVKASRLFAGHLHETQVKRLAEYFQKDINQYKEVLFDADVISKLSGKIISEDFNEQDLSIFTDYAVAYHALMLAIIQQQQRSTSLIIDDKVKRIFVDGGFAANSIYMHLLAKAFPACEVFAASVSQATAIGAALAIHAAWNTKSIPADLVSLRYYSTKPS